jgi:signal transduction histidine kinase
LRVKYIYQLLGSQIFILLSAFMILSLVFANYVGELVYQNKTEELKTYGESILREFEKSSRDPNFTLEQYASVLRARNILFSVVDQNREESAFAGRLPYKPTDKEWAALAEGKYITVKEERKRFNEVVSMVVVPYREQGILLNAIILISPISGSQMMIDKINEYLFYTVLLALAVSILLSWLLSRLHVKRIEKIREATSIISSGNYNVHVPSSNIDEIGDLANDFNDMAARLKASNEEIESLENRRRQFMADVSHELRTPLTTINGMIEGLKNDSIAVHDREKGINLVSQETNRLIRLVNENLDYEKVRSNQIKLSKEPIQLAELMEIIREHLLFQAEEKGNQIIVRVPDDIIVNADYDRLIQILINITKNSIQFTENGTIWLRGKQEKQETIIEIEDTGIGIDPHEVKSIWRRFYKAEISRTSNPYGEFGLGLSIVKRLIQLHDGEVDVFSNKGKGTRFVIRFPIEK